MSEFVGYVDLADFREILSKQSRDHDKRKRVGTFFYLKYLLYK